jgi:hypothetical protein
VSKKPKEPLTEQQVRTLLDSVVKELNVLDERRDALQQLARGYEMWLQVFGGRPDERGAEGVE